MKKFTLSIVFLAMMFPAICNADVITDLFKHTKTMDVTKFQQKDNDEKSYGLATLQNEEFMAKVKQFIVDHDDYMVFKDWNKQNTSYCIAFFGNSKIYALCINGVTVVAGEIK
jgi:hypothetical protein